VATPGVDFFRVDRSGAVRRLLTVAGILVSLGASVVGAHLVTRLGDQLGRLLSLAGAATFLVGLVFGFGAMGMLLFENVYLLIGEEGLLCHENGKDTKIAWGDLERVVLGHGKEEGFVLFERRGSETLRWFAGKTAGLVFERVEEAKRKALHGLLRAGG
jgi:hypothetical protein